MTRRMTLPLALVLAASLAAGTIGLACDDDEPADESNVQVVTSLEIFADMARNVGGDSVQVDALLPPGADPHTYELAPNSVADVARADVVFINGLGLEESIEDVVRNNADEVVELSEGLRVVEGEDEEGNPHLWLDVTNAMAYVERIRDTLVEVDPDGAGEYEANAEAYLAELGKLDADMEAAVQAIPAENRKLVTFHDAYPYLAERYGLEVVGVAVPSPGQEPNAQDIAALTETLESQGVPAAFKEPQFNAEVLELAADDAGVRVLDLLSDAFIEDVDSYTELMRYNMRQLEEGLGGN
ncbi:MAG: metal ABC transporter substrate-binding protein [Dehalococcoidia bacterium]